MAQFDYDPFPDGSGVNIDTRNATTGGSWTPLGATTGIFLTDGSGNVTTTNGTTGALFSLGGVPAGTSYSVSATFKKLTTGQGIWGPLVRIQGASTDTCYWFCYTNAEVGAKYSIFKRVAAFPIDISAADGDASGWVLNATHTMEVTCSGTNPVILKGYIDGVLVVSANDSSTPLSSAGLAGLASYNVVTGTAVNNASNFHADDITPDYTVSGPSSGTVGIASTNFTVTPVSSLTAIVGMHSSGSGTFTPSTLTFAGSSPQTFTYTPSSTAGSPHQISFTNSAAYINPPALSYAVNGGVTIAVNDANIFYSPYTWYYDGLGTTQAIASGSYLKFGFSGTSLVMNVDTGPMTTVGLTPASQWPRILWSIDNGPLQRYLTQTGDASLQLATGLGAGNHTVQLWYQFSDPAGFDRWIVPSDVLWITGFNLDTGATTVACSGTIAIQSGRMLIYGDSITEAVYNSVSSVTGGDATLSYPKALAEAFGCEYGQRGFQGQGWTTTGAGNCVPMYTPGDAAQTSWNLYDANHSLLTGGLFTPDPTHIVVVQGRNDNGANQTTLATNIEAWIALVRAAAPAAYIWMVIPFNHYSITGVSNGTNAYIAANPSDTKVFLIDCGTIVGYGLSGSSADQQSLDGVHPIQAPHATIAATMAAKFAASLQGGTGGTTSSLISRIIQGV